MKLAKICKYLATIGPIGYLPAPGTCATLVSMSFVLIAFWAGLTTMHLALVLCMFYALARVVVECALVCFAARDPQQIVVDEFIGYLFVTLFFPRTLFNLLLAAAIFRFFDIVKPLGVDRIQLLDGADGIILDDLMAGVYSVLVLALLGVGAQ